MNQITHLQQAEADGLTVTLTPSELTELNDEISDWISMYRNAANWRDRVRRVALEARDALRGYNHKSPIADRLTRVCRGEEL